MFRTLITHLEALAQRLEVLFLRQPVLDETGLNAIRGVLGTEIVKAKRNVEVLVIEKTRM